MAVAFRSKSNASSGNVSSFNCPIPAGAAAGDVLIMLCHSWKSGGGQNATSTGWTRRANRFSGDDNFVVFTKVADGTEGANATVAFGGNCFSNVAILAYQGATGIDAFADYGSAQASVSPTIVSVTSTVANTVIVGIVEHAGTSSATPASGWTERVDNNSANSGSLVYAMDIAQASAGASPTPTVTVAFAGGDAWTFAVAIAPAAAGPPVADFTGTPTSGTASLSVAFTDSSTNSPTSWAWDFGDGGTSSSQNPTHSYSSSGTYTVTLVATNAAGSDTKTRTGYIAVTEAIVYAAGGGIDIY